MILYYFVKLTYQSKTVILTLGIKIILCVVNCDVDYCIHEAQNCDMRHIM